MAVEDLVVIHLPNCSSMTWPLGCIVEVYPDSVEVVRVVKVNGVFKRYQVAGLIAKFHLEGVSVDNPFPFLSFIISTILYSLFFVVLACITLNLFVPNI